MIKIFKATNRYIRISVNLLSRLLLGAAYFILLFPFAIYVKLFADFLEIKKKRVSWINHNKIENIKKFLVQQ